MRKRYMNEKQQIEEMARVLRPLTLCSNCLSSLSRDKKEMAVVINQ